MKKLLPSTSLTVLRSGRELGRKVLLFGKLGRSGQGSRGFQTDHHVGGIVREEHIHHQSVGTAEGIEEHRFPDGVAAQFLDLKIPHGVEALAFSLAPHTVQFSTMNLPGILFFQIGK